MGLGEDLPGEETALQAEMRRLAERVERLEQEVAVLRAASSSSARRASSFLAPPPMAQGAATAAQSVESESAATTAPTALPSFQVQTSKATASLESRLGAQIFNRIGIIALLCAATLGLKLAIDNQWIGPVGRILIGLVAGAGVILWSERFRFKGFAAFSYSLKAVGTGVLYLSLWAAFQLYHLLPMLAALAGMLFVSGWNAYMAWAQNAELLAAYALIGGLSTPLLLSTGSNNEAFLFTYLLAIDIATVLLVRLRSWGRLLLGAFPATVLYFIGWYSSFYQEPAFAQTTIFVALFFVVFVSVSVGTKQHEGEQPPVRGRRLADVVREILLPVGNAAFVSLALYSIMQDSERHWFLPWLMLLLAAAYLVVTRLPQGAVPAAMHLSLAVVFLTIAVPLKASGHWMTVAWLVEGVALLWVSCRAARSPTPEHADSSTILRWLSAGCFVLGLGALVATDFWFGAGVAHSIFDHHVMTALVGVAVFTAAAWLALRTRETGSAAWLQQSRFALASLIAVSGIAALLSLREVATTVSSDAPHAAFANVDFAMSLMGIGLFAGIALIAMRLALRDEHLLSWAPLAAGAAIAINVVAVLAGVREVRALWPAATDIEIELQRSLAVSGFLMLYGAALLAIGFWRRSPFVRWQALALLVFSIAKTFLYDMRNLSQGYRFVSFLALGALLMAISYAYQRDWLALRGERASKDETRGAAQ